MGKLPNKRPSSTISPGQPVYAQELLTLPTLEDRQHKPNPIRYILKEDYHGNRLLSMIPKDLTTLVECKDNWYQVYRDGVKLHFRIGKEIMKDMVLEQVNN